MAAGSAEIASEQRTPRRSLGEQRHYGAVGIARRRKPGLPSPTVPGRAGDMGNVGQDVRQACGDVMVVSLSEGSNGMRHPFSKRFTKLNQHTIRISLRQVSMS